MANTNLPESVSPAPSGHLGFHDILHAEVNELSRNTGLRDIKPLLVNGWTADALYIERVRDLVHLWFKKLDGSAATSATFLAQDDLGAGFVPLAPSRGPAYLDANAEPAFRVTVNNAQFLGATGRASTDYLCVFTYRTTQAFPVA